jgi:exosome complex RNA-binding protein Rrp42 (RNase PH superfamily)
MINRKKLIEFLKTTPISEAQFAKLEKVVRVCDESTLKEIFLKISGFVREKNKIETAQKAGLKKFEKLTREKMLAAAAEIFEKIDAGFLKNLEENFD